MKPKSPDSFIKAIPSDVLVVLIYGPDAGLVRERATLVGKSVVDDLNDAFNVAQLTGDQVAGDQSLLADEMAAQSLMGGRRLVHVRGAGESCAKAVEAVLALVGKTDNLLLIEAGELKSAGLRKLCEDSPHAAALACYESTPEDVLRLAAEVFKARGIKASPDALQLLSALVAADRAMARQEIEKLALFAADTKQLEFQDVAKALGDSATLDMDDPAWAAADGNAAEVDRSLQRLYGDGLPTVSILRAAQRHFLRLYEVVGADTPPSLAVNSLKPPVFWKDKDKFVAQARRWSRPALEDALSRLQQAELDCKKTGLRDETMCARALMAIASLAGRGR